MVDKIMFSSENKEWETPQWLFDELNEEFKFNIDVAATIDNFKCPVFLTPEEDGLNEPWGIIQPNRYIPGRVFLNPPYGEPEQPCKLKCDKKRCVKRGWCATEYIPGVIDWIAKAVHEVEIGNSQFVVMLLPARTDTSWFHNYIYNKHEVRFIRGRLKFVGAKNSATFPSMIVVIK